MYVVTGHAVSAHSLPEKMFSKNVNRDENHQPKVQYLSSSSSALDIFSHFI